MDPKQLKGSVKVAILTMAIGREAAEAVVGRFSQDERALISRLQSRLGSVPQSLINHVAQEFIEKSGLPLQLDNTAGGDTGDEEIGRASCRERG